MRLTKYLVILFFILFSCQEIELLDHSNPLEDGRPFISTADYDYITSTTAELYGEFISTGATEINSFGHCLSASASAQLVPVDQYDGQEEVLTYFAFNDNDISYSNTYQYVTNISQLSPETKYYFRAFASNSIGIAYGDVFSFTTNEAGEPLVSTEGFSNITSTSVTLFGQIQDIGNDLVTQHGHCWTSSFSDFSGGPTINDSKTSLNETGIASFTSNVLDLNNNTNYSYRAYATNSFGTVYGSLMYFSTNNGEPTVVTIGSVNISASTVELEGNIIGVGDASVTQHGHCWSISTSPTISDSKTSLGPIGVANFISNVEDLDQNTSYYYRAYATNSFGTVYGSSMNFSTTDGKPTVVTLQPSNISSSYVDFEGEIISSGDAPVTQHGHCWSTNPNPIIGDPYTTNGNANTGAYISNTNLLSEATIYYFRAYATNSFGTSYGSVLSFTTNFAPCNITGINSSNTPYELTLSSYALNSGDNITVNMYHPFYSAGQSSVLLYKNETLITNLCGFCIFTNVGSGNYQIIITLPSNSTITPSNCYTIRVLGTSGNDPYLNISNQITIY